jgi:signal peptidase II
MTRAPGRPSPRQWLIFGALALAVIVVDQAVKAWVLGSFTVNQPVEVVGNLVRITFVHNTGALFGLFRDSAPLFGMLSIVVVGAIIWFHGQITRGQWLLTLALGLLLGGAIGNFIDRLRLGYVVDFVDMGVGDWRFYIYNIADSAITVSLAVLILYMLFSSTVKRTAEAAEGEAEAPVDGEAEDSARAEAPGQAEQ